MCSKHFNPSDPITMLSLLPDFYLACDTDDVHDGMAVWMCQFFLHNPASTDLQRRTQAKRSSSNVSRPRKQGLLTTYCEVVTYLLYIYVTDAEISLVDQSITTFKKTASLTATEYGHAL